MASEEKKCKYLSIEKEFRYTVDEFSAQLWDEQVAKKIFYGKIPLKKLKILILQLTL